MKKAFKTLALSATAAITMATVSLADPVYMIAQIQIEDQERYFDEYGAGVVPIILGAGGRILVATSTLENLEGEWAGNWTVVIEFPSEEAALTDWYNSDAYVDVHQLRLETTSMTNMVLAPAFVAPTQ